MNGELVNHFSSDDLHGLTTAGVLAGELHVELTDGAAESVRSEFLVHVDGISAGQVSGEDAEVLDAGSVLLADLGGGDDLTLDLADLVLSLHEVPELRPGTNLILGKDAHSVKLGLGNLLGRESSANNVKLLDLHSGAR